MQALKASWVGQTFALARRDDFGEKKPRRRRTKEERKKMVESFIKKYRTSNNGNFPSLNLTHKQVGGSFYIVREIVRDIIQENKVLGPGDASLKALNLEAGLDEHASGSTDPGLHLSLSSTMHMANHEGLEMSSMANEHQSKESYEVVQSVDQEIFASHANDVSVLEVMHDKFSDHLPNSNDPSQYDILVNAQCKEENLQKPSGLTYNNTGIHEQHDPVPQGSFENCGIHKIEQSHPFHQSVSITSTTKGVILDENDIEKKSRVVAEATDISAESNVTPKSTGTDVLLDAMGSVNLVNSNVSDQVVNHLVSGAKDFFPIATSSINTCDLDLSLVETKDLINSQEVLGMQNSEVKVPFVPDNRVPNADRTKSTETHSSNSVHEEATVLTSMMPQALVSPGSGTSSTDAMPALQPNDMENMDSKTESSSSESLSPSVKEISDSECSTKHEDIASSTERGPTWSSKSSGKARKESDKAEDNPIWATIKAFVDAVIKFWTE